MNSFTKVRAASIVFFVFALALIAQWFVSPAFAAGDETKAKKDAKPKFELRIWWPRNAPRQQRELYAKVQVVRIDGSEESVPTANYFVDVSLYEAGKMMKVDKKEKPSKQQKPSKILSFLLDKERVTNDSKQPFREGRYTADGLSRLADETRYTMVITAKKLKDGTILASSKTDIVYVK